MFSFLFLNRIFISFILCLVLMGTILDLFKTHLKKLLDTSKQSYQPIRNEDETESEKLLNTVVKKSIIKNLNIIY